MDIDLFDEAFRAASPSHGDGNERGPLTLEGNLDVDGSLFMSEV